MEKRLQEYRRLRAEKLGKRNAVTCKTETNQASDVDGKHGSEILSKNEKENQKDSSNEERKFKEAVKMIDSKRKASESFWERYHVENILKFCLWLCLLGFFRQIGFAAVYLIISSFYLMYASMKSRKRRDGPSAYSVFNEGFERIDGTFTAEQFENQLRHGTMR